MNFPTHAEAERPKPRKLPQLRHYPELVLAATVTSSDLDTTSGVFAGVLACLDTLARLKLNITATRTLMLLCKHGPNHCKILCAVLKVTPANFTGIITTLRSLGLVTTRRSNNEHGREVIVTATEAARKVVASVVALTALGQAANILNQMKRKPHLS